MRSSNWRSDVGSSDLEIAARDRSAGPPRRLDPVLDHRVEAVAPGRRRAGGIGLAVAGEAELLDHQRLAKRFGEARVGVDIGRGQRSAAIPCSGEIPAEIATASCREPWFKNHSTLEVPVTLK